MLSIELVSAARSGNTAKIVELASRGHNLSGESNEGGDLLWHYCHANIFSDTKGLMELIALGARPHNEDTRSGTSLIAGIWTHNSEVIRVLLGAGAEPNVIGFLGDDERTALDAAYDDYCDCSTDQEIKEMDRIVEMIIDAGGKKLADMK